MVKFLAVAGISALVILAFALELIYPAFMLDNFALVSSEILQKPWSILTHIFLHDPSGLEHIFYNMFALLLFGTILESIIGTRRFVLVFFAAGVSSALAGILFYESVIGASGAIFGIIGTLGIIRPRMTVWVMGIPLPMVAALGIWALLDIIGFFSPGNVANAAHLFGLAAGIVYGMMVRDFYSEKRSRDYGKSLSETELEEWEDKWMV